MLTIEERVARLAATKETRAVDFKSTFDPAQTADWCELLKDMFAFANSGGGTIIVGVDGKGQSLGSNVSAILKLDPADVGNKIRSYTQIDFDGIEILSHDKNGVQIAVIEIAPAEFPLIPTRPGTYPTQDPKKPRHCVLSGRCLCAPRSEERACNNKRPRENYRATRSRGAALMDERHKEGYNRAP